MSDVLEAITHDYDVFIIHAGCDENIANTICRALELEPYNFRCLEQQKIDAFKAGRPVFHSIVENINKAQVTLLILTDESFSTSWVSLETILALEYSVVRKELTLRLLLCDVDEKSIDFLKKGLLECVPDFSVDFNKENWKDTLVKSIKKKIELPEILPVGCLAHGQVFSHFVGYYVYLLPELESKLKETELYKQNPDIVCTKLLTFLPGSCEVPDTLCPYSDELGIKIEMVERLKFTAHHAGKDRPIEAPIYCVTKDREKYYFIADLPNVIKAMFKIQTMGLAKVDLKFQLARFYYTLNEVLNHGKNQSYVDKAVLVPYNDSVEDVSTVVFEAAQTAVLSQQMERKLTTGARTAQQFLPRQESYSYDFHIMVHDDEPKDREYAREITQYLIEQGKTVTTGDKPDNTNMAEARWIIYIISNKSLKLEGLMFKCLNVLVDSMHTNMLRVLPVLVDVEPRNLPQMIKWVTVVSVKDTNYKERLLQTMHGAAIKMQDLLPAGDVATGLVWAYILNYLPVALFTKTTNSGLDFTGRIQKLLQEKHLECGCINKVFSLVPKSCEAKTSVADEANKDFPSGLGPVQEVGQLTEVLGTNDREFRFYMFKYTDPETKQSVCFLSEYCTPINCMHEMATSFPFAGLTKAGMHQQAEDFVHLFPSIITREAVKKNLGDMSNLVQLIYYDDQESNLLSALQEQIKFNKVPTQDLVFAPQPEPMDFE